MERRTFLKILGASAATVLLAPFAERSASPKPPVEAVPSTPEVWCRPQTTVEDLFAEWEAQQNGDLDGFDKAILAFKERVQGVVAQPLVPGPQDPSPLLLSI